MSNMTGIAITQHQPGRTRRPRSRTASRRLNDGLAVFLMLVLALVPVPLGSNRPFFWSATGIVLGLGGLVYAAAMIWNGARLRFRLDRLKTVTVLFALLCLWLAVQMLPLGQLLGGFAVPGREGVLFTWPSLSIAPNETLFALIRALTYGLFFFLMLQVSVNRDRAHLLLVAIFVIVVLHALYALFALNQFGDTLLFFKKWAYQGVATGTFVNRNAFATFLAMGAVTGLAVLLRHMGKTKDAAHARRSDWLSPRRMEILALLLAGLIIWAALLQTQSRMGLFAALLGCAVVLILGFPRITRRLATGLMGLALLLGVVMGAMVLLYGTGVLERLGSVESAADVRFALYAQVWDMIWTRPLTGFGAGTFALAFPLFHQPPVSVDLVWDKAHNSYFTLWAELGVPAGTMAMLIWAILAGSALRRVLSAQRDVFPSLAAFAAIVATAVHALVDFSLEIHANMFLLLAIAAIGIATPPIAGSRDGEAPVPGN